MEKSRKNGGFTKLLLIAFTILLQLSNLYAQEKIVTGTVMGNDNIPLPGVNVIVKGSNNGTITDLDGNYSINVPEDGTLIFSFMGFETKEFEVAGKSVIDVKMTESSTALDEVVIIGYGTTVKSDLTGSVSKVKGETLTDMPVSRVDQMLQGKAAGVYVVSENGSPGAGATIRIRGGNSINANNEPLYVVDGFIVGTGYNLNNLNVNDIESIEILKDATAISIYGTRGANGVILITTKDGSKVKTGKPEISVNYYHGVQTINKKLDLMNGYDRAAFGTEAAEFQGVADPFADRTDITDTDWYDLVQQQGSVDNFDISFAGNTENINYYVSVNYYGQKGIIKGSGLDRYNFRSNIDVRITEKLKAGIRFNGTFREKENNKVSLGSMREVLTSFPVYDENGDYFSDNYIVGEVFRNPQADIDLKTSHELTTHLLTSAYLEFEIIEGLTLRSTIGPKLNWFKKNQYNPGILPQREAKNQGGQAIINSDFSYTVLQENTITYDKKINENHKINFLAGFTWEKKAKEEYKAEVQGLPLDALSYDALGTGDPETREISSGFKNARQLVSWLGRANYSFMNKYLLTLVGRYDGSSVYAEGNKYAFFPSAAVAWKLGEEEFVKNLNIFSNLKLRASYGKAGKESIDPYKTIAKLTHNNIILNDAEHTSVILGGYPNPDLKWETTTSLDLGLEMGFFNNRLSLEFDYYNKVTNDLLLARDIPEISGQGTMLENVGSIQNQGLELMVHSVNIANEGFRWETTLTLSGNRSEVLELSDDVEKINVRSLTQGGPMIQLIKGEPVGVFTGIQYLGTYKEQAEVDADAGFSIPTTLGGARFEDYDGDGDITVDDYHVIGNPEPKFYGGINNSFFYKGFQLDIYFQGSYGNDVYNTYAQQAYFGRIKSNVYADLNNRWTEDNPTSDIPRAGSMISISDIKSNTQLIEDGSHLRLKSVKLGYTFSANKMGINWVKGLNVYVAGTNLWLLTAKGFRGFDPEVNNNSSGSFKQVQRGVMYSEYPSSRTITFGIKAQF